MRWLGGHEINIGYRTRGWMGVHEINIGYRTLGLVRGGGEEHEINRNRPPIQFIIKSVSSIVYFIWKLEAIKKVIGRQHIKMGRIRVC